MKRLILLTGLIACMLSVAPLLAQDPDCRLVLDSLQPVIVRFNPYFANHQWSQENRMELARMGTERLLMITQDGCKRHHTVLTLVLDPSAARPEAAFWQEETLGLMDKVFYQNPAYQEFRQPFEEAFVEKYALYGTGRRFNFPVGTRNFICELLYQPGQGGRITVEMVEYIFKDEATQRQAPQPDEHDDGWLGNERP